MINHYSKYIIIFLIILFLYKKFYGKNKEHYSNKFYNKKCSDEYKPNDEERKQCYSKIFNEGSDIFDTCIQTNINEGINEDDANDYCKKWIGLVNTECTIEDCLENAYQKINDWESFLEIKNKNKDKLTLLNNIFKYKSKINNDYYKDFNLKLNELEILYRILKKKINLITNSLIILKYNL